jgi:GT2 family glycosyltransferase
MRVFTVIVTYNGMKWIDLCLNQIISQSEVIVVDNNSTDETVSFITNNYPEVNLISQGANLGFGGANNVGISIALKNGADAVYLLNQDAYAQPNCVKNLVDVYLNNKEFGIISPIHLTGNGKALDYSFQKLSYMSPLISDLIIEVKKDIYEYNFINAAAWFIPANVFYKVGGFDPLFFMYGEDDNYSQRVLYHNFKIGVIPNASVFHDSGNNNYEEGAVDSEKYYRQFVNGMLVKYANINTNNYKKLMSFKLFLLKKAIINIVLLKFEMARITFKKYNRINIKAIENSVLNNKLPTSNYLDV